MIETRVSGYRRRSTATGREGRHGSRHAGVSVEELAPHAAACVAALMTARSTSLLRCDVA
jgi:hypothetical protein